MSAEGVLAWEDFVALSQGLQADWTLQEVLDRHADGGLRCWNEKNILQSGSLVCWCLLEHFFMQSIFEY